MRELRSVAASYDTQAFIPAQRTAGIPEPAARAEDAGRPPRRRLGKRVALATGALGLVVGGVFASVQLSGEDGPAPKSTGPRTTASAFHAWQAKPGSKGAGPPPQCSYGAGRLLCTQPGLVFALSPADGSVLWRRSVARDSDVQPPVLSGGLVQITAAEGRRMEALDPASGTTRWHRNLPTHSGAGYAGGMLLLTRAHGSVTGVDSASGDTKWSRRIPGQDASPFVSFAGDPLAYATSSSDAGAGTRVTAVDPDTGDVRWDAQLKGTLQPIGTSDGSISFLSVDTRYGDTKAVVRYDPRSKTSRRVALPVPLQGVHAGVHGDTVYLLATGGSLEAVDMNARKQLWLLETSVSRGSVPVADSKNVYITAPDGRLLAVGAGSGKLVGQTSPRLGTNSDQVVPTLQVPLLAGHHVYATAPDGTVFAVNARNPSAW